MNYELRITNYECGPQSTVHSPRKFELIAIDASSCSHLLGRGARGEVKNIKYRISNIERKSGRFFPQKMASIVPLAELLPLSKGGARRAEGFVVGRISVVLGLLLFFISLNAKAQTAYHGGKGDGYSMAKTSVHFSENGKPDSVKYADRIYPSPLISGDKLWISFQQVPANTVVIQLIDATGKLCVNENISPLKNAMGIDLPLLARGMYIVRLINGSNVMIKKVLILER